MKDSGYNHIGLSARAWANHGVLTRRKYHPIQLL